MEYYSAIKRNAFESVLMKWMNLEPIIQSEFQKADSDLDYIQYRLEYEIKTNYPDSAGKKNPVTLLKELSAIKSRYQTLHVRFKPIAMEQKETKSRICATFNKTMTLIQELQKETDLESPSVVILGPRKIKSDTVSTVSPSISHEVVGPDAMIFIF
ncbi:spindle and kinetochore-associated protein 2 isoform X1 [Bos javanicus]|uniref:spindle and kinetochore-associated protein 2 isoform X1 n=1 Tax=Bos javanicus TaxID=9906 RepID=UPI002AA7BE7C|nr:spindle and kinetochore-associated protein 2 isoform X1 [Bos javanicus]